MSHEQKSNKMDKKKALSTPKEKKAAKKMKKDIQIPEVTDVFMAIVKEYNEVFQCEDWNAYLINNKEVDLEMVLVVSKGYDEDELTETSLLRHKIEKLPAKSFAKVELMQEEVLKLSNFFKVLCWIILDSKTFFKFATFFTFTFIILHLLMPRFLRLAQRSARAFFFSSSSFVLFTS